MISYSYTCFGTAKMNACLYVPTDGVDTIATCHVEVVTNLNSSLRSAMACYIYFIIYLHVFAKQETFVFEIPTVEPFIEYNFKRVEAYYHYWCRFKA